MSTINTTYVSLLSDLIAKANDGSMKLNDLAIEVIAHNKFIRKSFDSSATKYCVSLSYDFKKIENKISKEFGFTIKATDDAVNYWRLTVSGIGVAHFVGKLSQNAETDTCNYVTFGVNDDNRLSDNSVSLTQSVHDACDAYAKAMNLESQKYSELHDKYCKAIVRKLVNSHVSLHLITKEEGDELKKSIKK